MEEVFKNIKEKIKNQPIEQFVGTNGDWDLVQTVLDCCCEAVDRVKEEYNNGWIPCSELPEENGMYLCTVFHADDYVVWIMRFNDGEFLKPDDVEDWNYELLAWMPIAPYQPKGE